MPACRTGVPERGRIPYLGLDHVDTPGAEGLHAVVNVHNALTFGHVQHHIQNNVAACAASAGAGRERPRPGQGLGKGAQVQGGEKRGPEAPSHVSTTQGTGTQTDLLPGQGRAREQASGSDLMKGGKDRAGDGPWGRRERKGGGRTQR